MRWDAAKYDATHSPQSDVGRDLIAMAKVKADDHVLDIGCGTGTLTLKLARLAAGGKVVGLDPSAEMLEIAGQKAQAAGNITLIRRSAQEMNFSAEFDIAFSNSALQWIPEQEAVMALTYRALKNGGRLALQVPAKDFCWELTDNIHIAAGVVGMQSAFSKMGSPWRFPLKEEFGALLQDAGFSDVQTFYREYKLSFASINDVLDWGESAALRPYLPLMNEEKQERFKYAFAMNFENYRTERGIEFEFRRLFALAEKR
ncbi:MAG: methyltransferase domain-containing protein [Nitrospirae bacterium]|nr:methyltransferase domain-containing protein [Nitrospirota bacterium]